MPSSTGKVSRIRPVRRASTIARAGSPRLAGQRGRHQDADHRRRGDVAAAQREPWERRAGDREPRDGPQEERGDHQRRRRRAPRTGPSARCDSTTPRPVRSGWRRWRSGRRRRAPRPRARSAVRAARESRRRAGAGSSDARRRAGLRGEPSIGDQPGPLGQPGQAGLRLRSGDASLVNGLDLLGHPRPGVALGRVRGRPRPSRAGARARGTSPEALRPAAAGRRAGRGRRRRRR